MLASGCSIAVMRDPPAPTVRPTCITGVGAPTLDILGAVGAGVLAALFVVAATDDDGGDDLQAAGALAAGSALLVGSGIVGVGRAERCEAAERDWNRGPDDPPPVPVPLVERVTAKDPRAAQLTHAAHDAASRHRCGPARAVAASVAHFDAAYYERVFLANPTIARCF